MKNEFYHFGIRGQKWGVRRFETASGHLTEAGKRRYGVLGDAKNTISKGAKGFVKGAKGFAKGAKGFVKGTKGLAKSVADSSKKVVKSVVTKNKKGKLELTDKGKKVLKGMAIGCAAVATIGVTAFLLTRKRSITDPNKIKKIIDQFNYDSVKYDSFNYNRRNFNNFNYVRFENPRESFSKITK